jgi:hypothetical protein
MWLVIRSIQLVFQWKINGFMTYNPCFVGQSMIKLRSRQQYVLPKSKWELFNKWLCALYEESGRPISKNKNKNPK